MKHIFVTMIVACALVAPACESDSDGEIENVADSSLTDNTPGDNQAGSENQPDDGSQPDGGRETDEDSEADATPDDVAGDVVDACLNEDDQVALSSVDPEMVANGCATQNVGNVPGAVDCIEEGTDLSSECAGCFGLTIGCVFEQCLPACLDAASTECVECRGTNCDPPFQACSGLGEN